MSSIVSVSFETKCIAQVCAVLKNKGGEITGKSMGSGFFWRHNEEPYLITNRHCVTGKDGKNHLLPKAFEPTGLQVYFRVPDRRIASNAQSYKNRSIEFHLWEDGAPAWQEHPRGSDIDVVALSLKGFPDEVHCVNDKVQYDHWRPEAGTDCFILGYPEALSGSEGTPIWKRASIASEPELDVLGLPLFLCDTATRKGMSGPPVFAKMLGNFNKDGRPFEENDYPQFFGHWTKFLGVYSGRNGGEEYGFQLGRVWKASLIDDIVNNSSVPLSPFTKGKASERL